jgi:electron transfer flavoprotein beta subunit
MNIVVPVKLVPDLVEELVINDQGNALDPMWLRYKLNELDEHAIEQAVVLKERSGAQVTVIAPDIEGADDALFTASAKGADHLIKLCGDYDQGLDNHALARTLADLLAKTPADLLLTGVQAHNDLDGPLGALLAGYLGLPYIGYVSGVSLTDGQALVRKEYPGGLIAELEVALPAVLGIQAAERPPSYIAFSRIRQAMKTATLKEQFLPELEPAFQVTGKLYKPESGAHAEMLVGDVDAVAARLVEIFRQAGVL